MFLRVGSAHVLDTNRELEGHGAAHANLCRVSTIRGETFPRRGPTLAETLVLGAFVWIILVFSSVGVIYLISARIMA